MSYSCFMNTSIPIAFSIFSLFHAYYIWHFIYLYRNTDVFTHRSCILVPLRIYFTQELESLQSDHLNSSYGNFMPTSRFTDFTEEQFAILIFQCLVSIFDTGSLCSFKSKVLRVHFKIGIAQIGTPELNLRSNQSGILYSPTDAGKGLHMTPL